MKPNPTTHETLEEVLREARMNCPCPEERCQTLVRVLNNPQIRALKVALAPWEQAIRADERRKWGLTDVQRYDHATSMSRGERIQRLEALLYALAKRNPGIRADRLVVENADCPKGPRAFVGLDALNDAYVLEPTDDPT